MSDDKPTIGSVFEGVVGIMLVDASHDRGMVKHWVITRALRELHDRVKALEDAPNPPLQILDRIDLVTKDPDDPNTTLVCSCGQEVRLDSTVRRKYGSMVVCAWKCVVCGLGKVAHIHRVPHSILMTDAERLADLKARVAQYVAWVEKRENDLHKELPRDVNIYEVQGKLMELGLVEKE